MTKSSPPPSNTSETIQGPGLNVTIAGVLQKEVTPQDFLDHIDIADWLFRTRESAVGTDGRRHSRTFLEIQKYISPEVAD